MKNEDIGEKVRARSAEYQSTNKGESASGGDKSKFEFINFKDVISNLKTTEWRIRGVIGDKSSYQDFGYWGHYKSFVAIDRSLCIAAGTHTTKQT